MKRHGNLWGQVVAWENLLLAARKSQRGKRKREIVQRFHFHEESHLLRLQHELIDGSYRPVGSKTVIGAGSVVTRDVPSGVVAAGNPCRVIREITE